MNQADLNADLNKKEYQDSKISLKSFPRVVFVELTRNCNLECIMCDRAKQFGRVHKKDLDMKMSLYRKIAKELFAKAKIIDLHGNGESTQHPNFLECLKIADSYDARTRMVSNFNINDPKLLKEIVKRNVLLAISIDSSNLKEYERIRSGASFRLLIKNLRIFKELRERYGTCEDARVLMTLDRKNIKDINKMIDFIKKYGIKSLSVWRRYLEKDDKNDILYDIENLTKELCKSMDYANRAKVELRVISWPKNIKSNYQFEKKCIKPWACIHINYDGTFGICDFNEFPPGLAQFSFNDANFKKVWNSKFYEELRKFFVGKNFRCPDNFCRKICQNKNYIDFEEQFDHAKKKYIVNNFTIND